MIAVGGEQSAVGIVLPLLSGTPMMGCSSGGSAANPPESPRCCSGHPTGSLCHPAGSRHPAHLSTASPTTDAHPPVRSSSTGGAPSR